MQTRFHLAWLTPATLAGLSAPGLALQAPATPTQFEQYTSGTDTNQPPPSQGVLATTVTGAYPDLWTLQGAKLYRSHEVGVFDSYQLVSDAVVSVARLPGFGPVGSGNLDAVAGCGPAGVRYWNVVQATNQTQVISIDPSYVTGVQVQCGDVTGDGLADIVVLDAGQQVLRVYAKSPTWGLVGTINLGGLVVNDFDLAQLDEQTSRQELIVAVQDGARAYTLSAPSGGVITPTEVLARQHPLWTENHVVTLKDHVSVGIDGFAWSTRVGSGTTRYLTSASLAIPGLQPVVTLAPGLKVKGLSAGELDFVDESEGDEPNAFDVAVSYDNSSLVEFFHNRGPLLLDQGFARSPSDFAAIQIDGLNKLAYGTPVVGDIDGNGWGEILVGVIEGSGQTSIESLWLGIDPRKNFVGGGPPVAFGLNKDLTPTDTLEYWWVWDPNGVGQANITVAVDTDDLERVANLGIFRQVGATGDFQAVGTSRCDAPEMHEVVGRSDLLWAQISQSITPAGDVFTYGGDLYAVRVQPSVALPNGTRPVYWMAITGGPSNGTLPDWHNNPGIEVRVGAEGQQMNYNDSAPGDPPNPAGIGEVIPAIEVKRVKTNPTTPPTPNPNPSVGCLPGAS